MNFSDFERNSLIARGGYQFAWRLGGGVHPYARVIYERELKDDPILVTAGSNTMPGRFTLPGFTPPRQSVSTGLGLTAKLTEAASVLAGYTGRFGDGSRQDHLLSVHLRMAF